MFYVILTIKIYNSINQIRLIIKPKCASKSTKNPTTNTSFYTSTNPHTDSTFDNYDNFIDTYSILIINFIYNFLFNSFTITTYDFSTNLTVYPSSNASTKIGTNTSIKNLNRHCDKYLHCLHFWRIT